MEYKRLTTDKPINSVEASLNFAVAKNGTTVLRAAGGEEDINLCEYLFEEAKKHGYNCVSSADDILQGDCLACDCIINVLYIAAVQAAELHGRLKELEDKIENGELVEQKQGEWVSAYDYALKLGITDEKRLANAKADKWWKFCPHCEQQVKGFFHYCPNCGAKMKGAENG